MKDIRRRVIIENVSPEIDAGRYPIRRATGESVTVEANIFSDSHNKLAAELLFRKSDEHTWRRLPMALIENDLWRAAFTVNEIGIYEYTIHAWIDRFRTWRDEIGKKYADGQDISVEMLEGAEIVEKAAIQAQSRNQDADSGHLTRKATFFKSDERMLDRVKAASDPDFALLMSAYPDKAFMSEYDRVLQVRVELLRARFGTWYEMFPRSCADAHPGRHGTFDDCIGRLPYIADMGFDIVYLPPIHPIGRTHRKGKNNAINAGENDPGSPWAIGSEEGGHCSVHPELGTMQDFHRLIEQARRHEIEIAIDIAFQCSPDHPYVREHPGWFRRRPDNTIRYAENPPKKYQDIVPFDFETDLVEELRNELLEVVRFWIRQGIRIFRVDNPHTKPLLFWEWLIAECKREYPQVIFLAEAFTRPGIMYHLAKSGFTQSYTYFTWRNLKWEIEQYFELLTQTQVAEYFWPNLWPNTPDILPEYLQTGGRSAFVIRLALAATLSSSYGIYGPAFELCVNEPKEPFSEEYLDSEKYEIVHWNLNLPHSLKSFIKRINRIRKENPALQQNRNLVFHPVESEEIICFSKYTDDCSNIILVAVNLDPHHTHSATLKLPVEDMGITADQSFQMHDLISDARYIWHSQHNYIELNPNVMPVHIFRLRKRVRSESDFDYFM